MRGFFGYLTAAAAAMSAFAGAAHADAFLINYEAPGVQYTTASFTTVGVENFDGRSSGSGFSTNFGTGTAISATYSPVQINNADQYGGSGGAGQYAAAFSGTPYSLSFTADPTVFPNGVNYFGYWLSALDGNNQVEFYRSGTQVGSLSPGQVLASIGSNPAYFGNPNANFQGQNSGELYAFVNFYDTNGSFDEVRFLQSGGGGYESDNHTVGFYTAVGGVPEPATWAMLVLGVGAVGWSLRRRQALALQMA